VRILLVTNDYPPRPGGIQQYLGNLVSAHNGEVLVVGPADADAPPDAHIVRNPKRAYMVPTRATASWITDQARGFEPDVVLFGAPHPLPWLAPALRDSLGVPTGVICHGAEITIPAAVPGLRRALRATLLRSDVVFAVSNYTARRVERLIKRDVAVLGGGVDTDAFRPAAAREVARLPVVGCVSRFVPRKGQHRLIEAAAELRRTGTPVELLFVGRGRTEDALRRQAARRGVAARFEVDVPWARLPELYREMDLFCVPCRTRWAGLEVEGLGLVYLEAAATALPVLAGDSGGAPETVQPGETGYVVHSVGDIVEGLRMMLQDPDRARLMGEKGRSRVESDFTWDRVAARLVAGYSGIG
jgi:phosphatidylinositol alpha-1,6-mannosyltransferase